MGGGPTLSLSPPPTPFRGPEGVELPGVYVVLLTVQGQLYLPVYVPRSAGVASQKLRREPLRIHVPPIDVRKSHLLKIDVCYLYPIRLRQVKVLDVEVGAGEGDGYVAKDELGRGAASLLKSHIYKFYLPAGDGMGLGESDVRPHGPSLCLPFLLSGVLNYLNQLASNVFIRGFGSARFLKVERNGSKCFHERTAWRRGLYC